MSSVNLKNLSIQELKKLVKDKNEEVKKLEQEKEKEKLILAYKKLTQEKKEIKQKSKSKSKSLKDYSIVSVIEITRNGETFIMRDEGLKGFVIESYCELTGYPFVRFRFYDDYSKFFDINFWLNFLYYGKNVRSSLLRDDKRLFYNNLKEVGKIVDYCKEMKIEFNNNIVIYEFFVQIKNFIREYEDGFKHNNKK